MTRPNHSPRHANTDARRATLLAWIRDQEPRAFRLSDLPHAPGRSGGHHRNDDLIALCASGDLVATVVDGVFFVATQRALLPERRVTAPGLVAGIGHRNDDCVRMADCLDVLTRAMPLAVAGRCQANCAHYVPIPRESRIGLAMRSQSGLAAAQNVANGFMEGDEDA